MKKSNKIFYTFLVLIAVSLLALFFNQILDISLLPSALGSAPVAYAIIPFISLEHDEEACNMAGISTVVYVIKVADIESFPSINPTTPKGKVTYIGDFTLKSNKYWNTFYSTQQLGDIKSDVTGPRDGEFFTLSGSFFYPNTNPDALGMATLLKNADVVVIMKEFSGKGQMRVIGSKELAARIKPSENVGKAFTDQKGITFSVEAFSCTPAKIYEGAVVTENEVLFSAVRMAVDANVIDVYSSKRFTVGANTGVINLNSVLNMIPGDRVHISYDSSSTGSIVFAGAFGATATLNTAGEFFVIEKNSNNELVIIDGLFS